MLSLLIADDEKWVRRGLKTTIDWSKFQIGTILEARDGEEALQIVRSTPVDLIITDIKMPYRDGLDFLGEVRQSDPDVKVIIISGYGEFALAQQALKLGAVDYILKPIEEEALEKVVAKCCAAIAAEREKSGYSLRIETEYLNLARNHYLNQLLAGTPPDPESAAAKLQELGIALDPARITVAVLEPDGPSVAAPQREKLLQALQELCAGLGAGIVFAGPQERLVAFLSCRAEYDRDPQQLDLAFQKVLESAASVETMAEAAAEVAPAGYGGALAAAVSSAGTVDRIGAAYQECLAALEYRFFYGSGRVYRLDKFLADPAENIAKLIPINYDALLNNILLREPEKVTALLDEVFRQIDGHLAQLRPTEVKGFLAGLLAKMTEAVGDSGGAANPNEEPPHHGTLADYYAYVRDYAAGLTWSLRYNETKKKRFIEDAVKYLDENYAEKISMNSVAGLFYLNPSYFSKIFAEEVGETFHDFLARLRIERAKELLRDPALKVYEVAERVGYPDYRNFCKKFKELQGVTPLEFRNKVAK